MILLLFNCKLRTIKEPKRSSKKPRKFGIRNFWSTKIVIFSIIAVTLVTLSIILEANEVPLFTLHIHILFNITIVHICLPKYYITHSRMEQYFFSYLLTCEVYLIEVLEIMAQMLQYITFLSLKAIKVSSDFILNYLKKVVGGATAQKYQKQMLKP